MVRYIVLINGVFAGIVTVRSMGFSATTEEAAAVFDEDAALEAFDHAQTHYFMPDGRRIDVEQE